MTDNKLELTNRQIVDVAQALAEVAKKEFPVKISYWIGRIAAKLDAPYNQVMTLRDKLIITLSGGARNIDPTHENWEKFVAEHDDLMSIKDTIDFSPVSIPLVIPDKVNGKDVTLSLNTILMLENLIRVDGFDALTEALPEK